MIFQVKSEVKAELLFCVCNTDSLVSNYTNMMKLFNFLMKYIIYKNKLKAILERHI